MSLELRLIVIDMLMVVLGIALGILAHWWLDRGGR